MQGNQEKIFETLLGDTLLAKKNGYAEKGISLKFFRGLTPQIANLI